MLELRPNCEYCDKDLPADSAEACICSYECTFCESCVEDILFNVCPNCGGGFQKRPIRPAHNRREGVGLENHPPSSKRIQKKYSDEEIALFSDAIRHIAAEDR